MFNYRMYYELILMKIDVIGYTRRSYVSSHESVFYLIEFRQNQLLQSPAYRISVSDSGRLLLLHFSRVFMATLTY